MWEVWLILTSDVGRRWRRRTGRLNMLLAEEKYRVVILNQSHADTFINAVQKETYEGCFFEAICGFSVPPTSLLKSQIPLVCFCISVWINYVYGTFYCLELHSDSCLVNRYITFNCFVNSAIHHWMFLITCYLTARSEKITAMCISVCLEDNISKTTWSNFTKVILHAAHRVMYWRLCGWYHIRQLSLLSY